MVSQYLGIDFGGSRIGLALGDEHDKKATPYKTLQNDAQTLDHLRQIIERNHIKALVVGLPRGLDAQETHQTVVTRQFATGLSELGLPVHLQDEAVTSEAAQDRLAGRKRLDKGIVDREAAAIILQDYLDSL